MVSSTNFIINNQHNLHFCIGIQQLPEDSVYQYQIIFLQFSNFDLLQQIADNVQYSSTYGLFSGSGYVQIGSNQNVFSSGDSFELLHFRQYSGFFIDLQQKIDASCQIYLCDRCIVCLSGYVLSLNHKCVFQCDQTQFSQALQVTRNQCIRTCHTICSTCLSSTECLTCSDLRINPPLCTCPPGYFDDRISPNCRKYFPDQTTFSGQINMGCNVSTGTFSATISYGVTYQYPPKVFITLMGATYNTSDLNSQVTYINTNNFTITVICLQLYHFYSIQWMSEVGTHLINIIDTDFYPNSNTITSQLISTPMINGIYYTIPSIKGWSLENSSVAFSLQITNLLQNQFSLQSSKPMLVIHYNQIQSDFQYQSYNVSVINNTFQIEIDIPKSIRFINLFQGISRSPQSGVLLLLQGQRTPQQIVFKNRLSMKNIQGTILFAGQKCFNISGPCDFYQSYISSCSLGFQLCQCNEIGYYQNISNYCDKCDNNCYTCINTSNYCTACKIEQGKILYNGLCLCLNNQYVDSQNICRNCDIQCLTCSGPLNSNCNSCKTNAQLIQNQCICEGNYYYDGVQCSKCHITCYTCDGGFQNNCLSCQSPKLLDITTKTCQCPMKYFLNGDYLCQPCDPTCLTCNGVSSTACLTCDIQRVLKSQSAILQTCECYGAYYSHIDQCLNCDQRCLTCQTTASYCLTCPETRTLIDSICQCNPGYYESLVKDCYLCPKICKTCSSVFNCLTCIDPLQLIINGMCSCPQYYYINPDSLCSKCKNTCVDCLSDSICTSCSVDKILQSNQCQCDHQKYLDDSGICQQCSSSCLSCSGPGFYQCITCHQDRFLSINQQCLCNTGYYLDSQNKCQACNSKCKDCINGVSCSSCPYSLILDNQSNLCICDQGYYEIQNQQLCGNCLNECISCIDSQSCQTCQINRKLVSINYVLAKITFMMMAIKTVSSCENLQQIKHPSCNIQNCSDGIWTSNEQCDDGNEIQRDGCTNCIIDIGYKCTNILYAKSICYQCQEKCIKCIKLNQIICEQCQDGYYLSQNKCQLCSSNCETCISQTQCKTCPLIGTIPNINYICPICQIGFYNIKGVCVSMCGDGILSSDEYCDNGGNNGVGGCTITCQQDIGFTCLYNICTRNPIPEIDAKYINSTTKTQLEIQNTKQNVSISDCDSISVSIDGFDFSDFNVSKLLNDGSCNLIMEYRKTITENNLIRIKVKLNQIRLIQESYREITITPRRQIYYSQSQQTSAKNVQQAQNSLSILMYLIGPLSILLGGFEFFLNLLDILSWINNLYYMNIYFPLNVQMIFQNSLWSDISIIPTTSFPQFNKPSDPYYRESPPHFMEKGSDPLFINNIIQDLGLWIISIILYLVASQQQKSIEQHQLQQIVHKNTLTIYSTKILTICLDYKKNILSYFLKILNLSYLDIVNAILLQITCFELKLLGYFTIFINMMLAYFSIILCAYLLLITKYVSDQHLSLLQNRVFKQKYGTIYEGINIKNKTSMQYTFINIIRKTLYLFSVVYFYHSPLFQTATCCFISSINVGFIIYQNPFKNRKLLIQTGIPDCCIFLLMIMFVILAIDDQVYSMSDNQRYNLGWVIISILILSIGTQLFFMFQQFFMEMRSKLTYLTKKIRKII
ncbi:hypothetical protein pb186bvf_005524 [Paramecium bursaria]